jgi:hypothetical protein
MPLVLGPSVVVFTVSSLEHIEMGTADAAAADVFYVAREVDQNRNLVVSRSTDGGLTWSPVSPISSHADDAEVWAESVNVNSLVAVYVDYSESGRRPAMFRSSISGGVGWSSAERISGMDVQAVGSSIATCDGIRVAVWSQLSPVGVYTARSEAGQSWSKPLRIDDGNATTKTSGPRICVDGSGRFFCAWMDNRSGALMLRGSTSLNGGKDWSLPNTSFDFAPADDAVDVAAADVIHMAWADKNTNEVKAAESADGGMSWSAASVVGTAARLRRPSLAAYGSRAICGWQGNADVVRIAILTGSWSGPVDVAASAALPAVALSSSRLLVSWTADGRKTVYARMGTFS